MTREVLFRLEHIFEEDEDPILSQPVTINMVSMTDIVHITVNMFLYFYEFEYSWTYM